MIPPLLYYIPLKGSLPPRHHFGTPFLCPATWPALTVSTMPDLGAFFTHRRYALAALYVMIGLTITKRRLDHEKTFFYPVAGFGDGVTFAANRSDGDRSLAI